MNYWWVNQRQTYEHEVPGGYLWAPKLDKTGHHRTSYDSMLLIEAGDVLFSYFGGSFRALGVVLAPARSCPRPNFGFANQYWDEDGWLVDVEFQMLSATFDPKELVDEYRLLGPVIHGPINSAGRVNMEYLYAIPENLGAIYERAISVDVKVIECEGLAERKVEENEDRIDQVVAALRARQDIGPTEIRALTLARRGQGYFKKEVGLVEHGCRVTGVTETRHLRASHIKPWSVSNDVERLDGANGLLLAPHIDHLFDQGFISFKKAGVILTSAQLSADIAARWKLNLRKNVGKFNSQQESYLEYHRDVVFQSSQ